MKIIGHRGARGLAPENTLASLYKATEHQVDMLEFDLRVTKDNIVVLHHDPKLVSPNGQKFEIAKTSYRTLKEHKPGLAKFEDVMQELAGKVDLYIEVKPGVDVKPITAILKPYSPQGLWLGSKSQKTLRELHTALPQIPKIVIEPWSGIRARLRAHQVNAEIVSMNQLWLWSGFIRAVKNSGLQLFTYTLNDPAKARRWEKHGLAGVVTDYPDHFES